MDCDGGGGDAPLDKAEVGRLIRRWLPDRFIKVMGGTAYSVLELGLHTRHQQVTLITTGRFDAVLHEPPPERTQHTIGRPRAVGKRLPALEQVLQEPQRSILDLVPRACYKSDRRRAPGTHRLLLPLEKHVGKDLF
jgi:hypothetical protein